MTPKETVSLIVSIASVGSVCFLLVGILIGYFYSELKEQFIKLAADMPEPAPPIEVGVIQGSFKEPPKLPPLQDEKQKTGAVIAKSPLQLEYEEKQRIRKISGVSV